MGWGSRACRVRADGYLAKQRVEGGDAGLGEHQELDARRGLEAL